MRDRPTGLTDEAVVAALKQHWDLHVEAIEYAPLGFGSYHWTVRDADGVSWFLTADHLRSMGTHDGDTSEAFAALYAALSTSMALAESGLDFIVAPRPSRLRPVVRIAADWSLAVFPCLDAQPAGDVTWEDPGLRDAAARIVARLHGAPVRISMRRWSGEIPHRAAVRHALIQLERPWAGGPYAERTLSLLQEHRSRLEATFAHYDALAAAVLADDRPWVVTHGEPHSGNFLHTTDGRLLLIDCETIQVAPPERDLWMLTDDSAAVEAYSAARGDDFTPDATAMELFRLRWSLADIAIYVRGFRAPHQDTPDARVSWDGLVEALTDGLVP